jgi:GDP-L-fucose synthase
MENNSKILVLGSSGLVGSSVVRLLHKYDYRNVLTPKRNELNLFSLEDTIQYFKINKPEYVVMAAAKVGGIFANDKFRADFIWENLQIQNCVFKAAYDYPVKKFLFLGSSCIYPKNCPQPMKEEDLLTSALEPTNEPYAIAKIAGLKMAESFNRQYGCPFYSIMPTNLYGENDNFDLENAHVAPMLMARMNLAIKNNEKAFEVRGTGTPRRELMYIDDMAEAILFLLKTKEKLPSLLNVGTGIDNSIKEIAEKIAKTLGYQGELHYNHQYPDGTMKKLLDVSKINKLGWKARVNLDEGLQRMWDYYKNTQ